MLQTILTPDYQIIEAINGYPAFPIAIEVGPEPEVARMLADLSPDRPWLDRKTAAQRLGSRRSRDALTGLLDALPRDPFWMVRCAIIQALVMIGDSRAVPALREAAQNDGFQVVRSHALRAIQKLS